MTIITTPASIDDAIRELSGLAELLTATEWHRAAIVATFVRLREHAGQPEKNSPIGEFFTCDTFAALRQNGLKSEGAVRRYVRAWLDASDGTYPTAGKRTKLPTVEWGDVFDTSGAGGRPRDAKVADAVTIIERRGVQAVIEAMPKEMRDTMHDRLLVQRHRESPHTSTTRPMPDPLDGWNVTRETQMRDAVAGLRVDLGVIERCVKEGDLSSEECALRDKAIDLAIEFAATHASVTL